MSDYVGSLTLYMTCTQCNVDVFKDSIEGFWCCECYAVPVYELLMGAADIPSFWVDSQDMEAQLAQKLVENSLKLVK